MTATSIKIDSKKYRIIPEEDYLSLMQDIKDLKKILKRRSESEMDARTFFKSAEAKLKSSK
jgi:hypothetical protein